MWINKKKYEKLTNSLEEKELIIDKQREELYKLKLITKTFIVNNKYKIHADDFRTYTDRESKVSYTTFFIKDNLMAKIANCTSIIIKE
jgi:hypothetical protein